MVRYCSFVAMSAEEQIFEPYAPLGEWLESEHDHLLGRHCQQTFQELDSDTINPLLIGGHYSSDAVGYAGFYNSNFYVLDRFEERFISEVGDAIFPVPNLADATLRCSSQIPNSHIASTIDMYTHTNADADAHANTNADADVHANTNVDADAHANTNADAIPPISPSTIQNGHGLPLISRPHQRDEYGFLVIAPKEPHLQRNYLFMKSNSTGYGQTRRAFSPERLEAYKAVREQGACLKCIMTKKRVRKHSRVGIVVYLSFQCSPCENPEEPCVACQSVEGRLWHQPCFRYKLSTLLFYSSSITLLYDACAN
jgi:hypothetical protein